MTIYGKRIKGLRTRKGWSAEQLAEKVGLAPTTIYRYESGKINGITTDKLLPIADALGVTPAYLMGWEDPSSVLSPDCLPLEHEAPATGADVPGVASRVVKKPEAPQKKKTALDEVIDKLTVIRDSIPSDLRPDEQQFLRDYRMLNNAQRTQLRLYMDALLDSR